MIKGVHGRRFLRLKVCPFCGAEGVFRHSDQGLITAGCTDGHAMSPEYETKEEALDWWNIRHTGPQFPVKSKIAARKVAPIDDRPKIRYKKPRKQP